MATTLESLELGKVGKVPTSTKKEVQSTPSAVSHQLFQSTFGRLDPVSLGAGVGVASGLLLSLVIAASVISDDGALKSGVELFRNYFPGLHASPLGIFLGGVYGTACGFVLGYTFAASRNLALRIVIGAIKLTNYSRALLEDMND